MKNKKQDEMNKVELNITENNKNNQDKGSSSIKRHRLNIGVSVVIAVVLVILLNIFVGILTDKFPVKFDLTSNKLYELSEKTQEYLKSYETPTTIYVLASEADQDDRVRSVLDNYAALNKNINVKNINMKENPTFGKGYVEDGVSLSTNSIIVDSGNRHKIFTKTQLHENDDELGDSLNVENNITAALKYVSSDTVMKAYFTKGHNEDEIKGAVDKLTEENFEVGEVTTLTEDIPSDTSLLIIVNPTADFSENEITKLDSYLTNGGNVQVYFNVGTQNVPNLYKYLESWGIGVNDDVVLENDEDRILLLNTGAQLSIPEIKDTEFTNNLIEKQRILAYFSNTSKSLTQKFEANDDISVISMLTSSDNSYTSTTYEDVTQGIDDGKGNYIVSALAVDSNHNSSVYVSGNTFLLQNDESVLSGQYSLANYDYFMNLINYTLDNGESYTVNKKILLDGNITVSKSASTVIMILVVAVIPLAVLLIGFIIWIKRRNL